jgi:hypothetical protein
MNWAVINDWAAKPKGFVPASGGCFSLLLAENLIAVIFV